MATLGRAGTAGGQSAATPPGRTGPSDPAACVVEPRSVAEIAALLAEGAGGATVGPVAPASSPPPAPAPPREPAPGAAGTPLAPPRPLPFELPVGAPADRATSEAAVAYVACANAGDILRLMALVSDDLLRRGFVGRALTEAEVAAYVSQLRPPPPSQQRAVVAVRDVRLLPDGAVAALGDLNRRLDPGPTTSQVDYVELIERDGRLVIDVYVADVGRALAATPAP